MWAYKFNEIKAKYPNKFYIYELKRTSRRFIAFENHVDYYTYMNTLNELDRNHYETIQGDVKQKPKFDIDIPSSCMNKILTPTDIINDLIFNIINYAKLLEFDIQTKDILLYESHGKDKYSFHIVINNWYHNTNREAKRFYQGVVDRMHSEHASFIDSAVYSSLQEFRMFGSCKCDTSRFKRRIYSHKYYNEIYLTWDKREPLEEFSASLITIFNDKERHLYIEDNEVKKQNNEYTSTEMAALHDIKIPSYFTIDKNKSYGIRLQRKKDIYGKAIPGPCLVCRDTYGKSIIHENDNAYVTISDNVIYFRCFRNKKLSYLINIIKMPSKYKLALEASNYRRVNAEENTPVESNYSFTILKNIKLVHYSTHNTYI